MFIPSLSLRSLLHCPFFTARRLESNGSHETKRNSAVKLLNEGEFKEKGL